MKRRAALLAAAACAIAARAQRPPVKIAWLSPNERETRLGTYDAFIEGMTELGYVQGRDYVMDSRWAAGSRELLTKHAQEAAQGKPDIFVTQTVAAFEVTRLGLPQPIVFGFSGDPVIAKLAESIARPGRNATGISMLALDLVGKRMELLKELSPRMKRVAVVANPAHPGVEAEREMSLAAASRLGLAVEYLNVRNAQELPPALDAAQKANCESLVLFPDNGTIRYSDAIAKFSRAARMPTISGWSEFAERGNLLSYGPELRAAYRRLASHVDKILKGRPPGEIPVELPSRVELVVNMAAARELRITVPQTILARADRVID
ncbi:ABC transporter substrate-binding protein [Ramlibacter albus]|uniref:ABC transporter substrate-binding protein n=1 Tax=Ramlibacter albus TaxID=2079448 RepID=A0A923M823_9BURK|nr:ABC transporter substrate-binding protein [Ramlibacter albus]MBC5765987.1 ABC transporter substrate-binding protein [Ramlibacter albus]